ncbi:MAG TPA: hypothetical protein VJ903_03460 [Clostridia bacterium]|nr:hypothetical protein [Clostridia bacterium]
MKTVFINGTSYIAEDNAPLKKLLKELGFIFPCGGEGKCGRCKITCEKIPPTDLDRRFLNQKQLENGTRLSCDKLIIDNYDIAINDEIFQQNEKVKKLSECRISAIIGSREVILSILDDEIVETKVLPNPLYEYGSFSSVAKKYTADRPTFSKLLRNCIGKESVELFEKYGTAKADTLALSGSELYIKILLGLPLTQEIPDYNALVENDNLSLPTEQVYVLPMINQYVGGDLLCEMVELKENSLLINCEDVCAFAYIGAEENTLAAMWDMKYQDKLELVSIKSVILALLKDKGMQPLVYLYGNNIDNVAAIVEELNLTHIDNLSKRIENTARACLFSRFRAKLSKEKARSRYVDIVNSEEFHDIFANNYNSY